MRSTSRRPLEVLEIFVLLRPPQWIMAFISVHVGRWQDFSKGCVSGDVFTLDVRWGGYLIGALAAFIGFVGTSFWTTIELCIRQHRAEENTEEDGVYFQHQIIYRNPDSPAKEI
jgi:hypothetical protein